MLKVVRYTADKKNEWDEFVKISDYPVFMFYRDYIEYHKDRFEDHSLLFYSKNKLKAVLPGHTKGDTYYSHQGLTFGGVITKKNLGYIGITDIYKSINSYLTLKKYSNVYIKTLPSFYSETQNQSQLHIFQSESLPRNDLKLGAYIYCCKHEFPKSTIEKRKLKLERFELTFSDDYETFWEILENNLLKQHNTKPVHTLEEIRYLKKLFPESIQLFIAKNKETGKMDAGVVLYKFKNVLKLQYQAASEVGRSNRASHALYHAFISNYISIVDYIDLGNCMDDIDIINTNLLYIKERFGATVYSMLSYKYNSHLNLS